MRNKYDVIVIGCGTSAGFLLGFLRESGFFKEKKILILEKGKESFKKICASGNGRCNFSNASITADNYYSFQADDGLRTAVFEQVKKLDLKEYFHKRGIPSVSDEYGRLMPFTNSAKTIAAFLENNLKSNNIEFRNYAKVSEIAKKPSGAYTVKWSSKAGHSSADSDIVVFSAGGSAYPQSGTDGSAFAMLKELGHTVTGLVPGIVPLETPHTAFHKLAGLKMECQIFFEDKFTRKGELLFTKYGISGPNVLYASNVISMALREKSVDIRIDFLPGFKLEYFKGILKGASGKTVHGVFGGVLNSEFLGIFVSMMLSGSGSYKGDLDEKSVEEIYTVLVDFKLAVSKTRSFKEAQVSIGGAVLDEIDPYTFESKINKNIYILGEAIDYTGGCGGYNIHWCAATAKAAAQAIFRD